MPSDPATSFLALHQGPDPLLLPNPWDIGSARLLAAMGFRALATTSGGYAASLGRLDGNVTRDEALAHAAQIVGATDLPVSADLEDGFVDDPSGIAATIAGARAAGLAGCSIEDYQSQPRSDVPTSNGVYDTGLAVERIAAAAEAAHSGTFPLVLTARAENFLRGRTDLADTIDRLQRYQAAGADVLYAPGISELSDIDTLVRAVDRPVNVLVRPGVAPVAELARVGVRRISIGGAFAYAALGAVTLAARELLDHGTYGYLVGAGIGAKAAHAAFGKGA
ncbi:MAG: isocitrate lyase/phosphoenolpyruvate mutase family protein [Acidimicrobiales bacterium]